MYKLQQLKAENKKKMIKISYKDVHYLKYLVLMEYRVPIILKLLVQIMK